MGILPSAEWGVNAVTSSQHTDRIIDLSNTGLAGLMFGVAHSQQRCTIARKCGDLETLD